jgi:hypothetical protein
VANLTLERKMQRDVIKRMPWRAVEEVCSGSGSVMIYSSGNSRATPTIHYSLNPQHAWSAAQIDAMAR